MTRPPLLTVAVPTLRRPAYLAKTLDALLGEDFADAEILVSDNGSGDGTPDVVPRGDPRVRFRSNAVTVPAVTHWNQLVAEARGRHFLLVSDDDLVAPGFLAGIARALSGPVEPAVVLTRFDVIDERGELVRELPAPAWDLRPGVEVVLDWAWSRAASFAPTFVSLCARTDRLRALGGFPDLADALNADNALFVTLALEGPVALARDSLMHYRVHLTSSGLGAGWQRLALSARQMKAHLRTHPPTVRALAALDAAQRRAVLDGIDAMLAAQYLGRVESVYAPRSGHREALRALFGYRPDRHYARGVVPVAARLAGRAVRDFAARSR